MALPATMDARQDSNELQNSKVEMMKAFHVPEEQLLHDMSSSSSTEDEDEEPELAVFKEFENAEASGTSSKQLFQTIAAVTVLLFLLLVASSSGGNAAVSSPPTTVAIGRTSRPVSPEVTIVPKASGGGEGGEGGEGASGGAKKDSKAAAKAKAKAKDNWTLPYRACRNKNSWKWYGSLPRPAKCFDLNLFFIKGPKTGSSTTAGIARRIGARYGLNCVDCRREDAIAAKEPRVIADHVGLRAIQAVEGAHNKELFIMAFVRNPAERCLSLFYHLQVSKSGAAPTDANIMDFARSDKCTEFLYRYYDMGNRTTADREINFFGVTDRYSESLVALALKLGLSAGDMLYIPAKVSKPSALAVPDKKTALVAHVPLHNQTDAVKSFFRGEFTKFNVREYKLFKRANRQLDALIKQVGPDNFRKLVAFFDAHQKAALQRCAGIPNLLEDCYTRDNGCGKSCLDAYASSHEDVWTPLRDLVLP